MDSAKPCPETWALHASAQIAAQAMDLAGIARYDTPAGCAESKPEVFAALIHAHPLNRIANALGALERIANALEARGAEGAQLATAPWEPAPRANPVASWGGWRRDRTSFVNSSRGFVEVPEGGRLAILPIGRKFRAKDFWAVDPGDHWAPIVAFVDWSFVEEPASTTTTAPQEPPTGDPITPSAPDQSVPTEPVASDEHWRTGFPSAGQTCDGWVEVRTGGQPAALPDGRALRVQHRLNIEIGDCWAPMALVKSFTLRPDSPTTPAEPTAAPSAPQEHPASDPGTLVLGTSRERRTGGSGALQGEGEVQGASEGAQAGQEGPVAASGGHPLDQGGWIRSRVPTEGDADEEGDVKVPVSNDWFWCSWRIVTPGQPWAPATVEPSPYTPKPLWAHLAYPSSQGWIHDRVPGPEDGDKDGDVVVACQGVWASTYAHWSHIVPGQPWRPFT